jgi:NADP-dependent 3-hydroxy acid dehydrogenase YdfG
VARTPETLEEVATIARKTSPQVITYPTDLTVDENIYQLKTTLADNFGQVDIIVHSAGIFELGTMQDGSVEDLDAHYRANLRAPYLLTQTLLPMVLARKGQIVFINSSAVLRARANMGQYTAMEHALKAITDSLREEVNVDQVRVLSIYPGRTATPRQEMFHRLEGKPYHPERLMQPEDLAEIVINSLCLPRTTEITDIYTRPFLKPLN